MYKREWNRRVNITLSNPLSGNKQCDEGPFLYYNYKSTIDKRPYFRTENIAYA